jgi:DNA-binding response OmpR family regulator
MSPHHVIESISFRGGYVDGVKLDLANEINRTAASWRSTRARGGGDDGEHDDSDKAERTGAVMAEHTALIVEDDPQIATILAELVASLGHAAIIATTLAEVRAAAMKGGYCYVLLDMQIPADTGANAYVGSGETALTILRARDSTRNAAGRHLVPIVVVSSYSTDPDFVSKMYDSGADGFIAKPFGDGVRVIEKIRTVLERAGRTSHDECPGVGRAAKKLATRAVVVAIDGERRLKRNYLTINGKNATLTDSWFAFFLRLVAKHLMAPGEWADRSEVGIAKTPETPSRTRAELVKAAGDEGDVLESSGSGDWRLRPSTVIERVDWARLTAHPDPGIAKLAEKMGKRKG